MNTEFVPAKASDAATISALRQRIWDTTYRGIYRDDVIDDFDYDRHQQRDLKKISDAVKEGRMAPLHERSDMERGYRIRTLSLTRN